MTPSDPTKGQNLLFRARVKMTLLTPKVSNLNSELDKMTFYTRHTLTIIQSYRYQCSVTGLSTVRCLWCSITCDSTQSQNSFRVRILVVFDFFYYFRWTTKFEFFRIFSTSYDFFEAPRKNGSWKSFERLK